MTSHLHAAVLSAARRPVQGIAAACSRVVIAAALGFVATASPSLAQTVSKPAAAPAAAKKNPDTALKAYSAGTRAFETGKMADAITQLSVALSSGGLQSTQMAKALYYRGAAYRKQGKPAMAISDLTSSLWLKGGLNDTDRALAADARQGAYREAGLGDSAPPIPSQQQAAATPAPAAPAATTPATAAAAAPASTSASPGWQPVTGATSAPVATLGSEPVAPAPRAKVATAPLDNSLSSIPSVGSDPDTAASGAPSSSTLVSTAPAPAASPALTLVAGFQGAPDAPTLNAVPSGDAAPAPGNPLAGAGQAVGGFFDNVGSSIGKMFGAGSAAGSSPGSEATLTPSSPVMTSSTGPIYGSTEVATAAPAANWGEPVVAPAAAKSKKVAAASAAAVSPAVSGNILLQVAAVRSREEADQLTTRLRGTPAVKSANKQTFVDEAVIGNMGTFYRVRVGPFATSAEPAQLCAVLKPDGYDCLVVGG